MADTINGRTPEEIKKGLECCSTTGKCEECAYAERCAIVAEEDPRMWFGEPVMKDALALINQLLEDKKQLERELDALLADLNLACGGKFVDICCICGHYTPEHPGERCELKGLDCRWIWRGVQK